MHLIRLISRNLRFYVRSWLLTAIAVMLGMTILTGALITGDSVRSSLNEITRLRLGKCRFALAASDRYFRDSLAVSLETHSVCKIIPVLRTHGSVSDPEKNSRLNRVEIIGVDEKFKSLWKENPRSFMTPADDEAVISKNVAGRLHIGINDFIVVKFPAEGFAPANAPFVSEASPVGSMRLRIAAVADDKEGGRFSLDRNQASPYNVCVSRKSLAKRMGVSGFANTLLVDPGSKNISTEYLNDQLRGTWAPEDAGLRFSYCGGGIIQLTSERVFIEDTIACLVSKVPEKPKGILTYLVNEISFMGKSTPYSFVTAADSGIVPLNPGPGEIVINDWLAKDLAAKPGDKLLLKYWIMSSMRSLKEDSASFVVHAVVPVENSPAGRMLMPEFPGIRNSGNCRDWETGTPVDLSRIRNKDEAYWNQYRGTPKAWINMKDGRKIWKNPFGSHTAFRFGDTSCIAFLKENFHRIDPSVTGMTFRPVFLEGTAAAQNATDFGQLFLSLGGVVLVAAFMLAGMFLSFFLWRRMQEIALYRALGFENIRIFRIFFVETLFISVAGNLVGLLLAIVYSWLMISGLNSIWNDAVGTSGLELSIDGISLAFGFAINTILSLAVFSGILWRSRKRSLPSPYLQPVVNKGKAGPVRKTFGTIIPMILFGSAGFISLSEALSGRFYPSAAFMISGVLVLAGLVFAMIHFFPGSRFSSDGIPGTIYRYILRNLRLRKAVSITALLLLSIGTFVVFVTAFNRKSAYDTRSGNHSGTGGFRLWMETDLPLYSDLNRAEGRKKLGIDEEQLPGSIRFVSLPQVRGEDASCLNLNQVSKPGLTGIPAGLFDTRQSFSFASLAKYVDPEHPWKTLKDIHDSGCVNGFIDQTALTWNLHKKIGDTLNYLDEKGRIFPVRISGSLDNSVFQGNLLVSDSLLNLFFPSTVRTREMLIDLPEDDQNRVIRVLEERLTDQGAVVIPAREKLSSFNAVENTYLDVFLVLGGFGLILGTAGAVVVVMRNLRDRRREIALYLSLGIHQKIIYRLLARESQAILLSGVAAGILSAFAGTLPSLVHSGGTNLFLAFFIIIIVLINGLFWIRFLTKKAIKAVRREPLTRVI